MADTRDAVEKSLAKSNSETKSMRDINSYMYAPDYPKGLGPGDRISVDKDGVSYDTKKVTRDTCWATPCLNAEFDHRALLPADDYWGHFMYTIIGLSCIGILCTIAKTGAGIFLGEM